MSGTGWGDSLSLSAANAAYVAKSTLTTKGDIYAATAASTPARLAVGADGTSLMALAAQSAGVAYRAIIPVCAGWQRTGMAQATTTQMNYIGMTGSGELVVPVGWKLAVYALSLFSPSVGGSGQTSTLAIFAGASVGAIADVSSNFGTCQVATGSNVFDSCEPTSPPYIIDATSAEQVVDLRLTNSATTGNVAAQATLFGIMWKP